MTDNLSVTTLSGSRIIPFIDDVAGLRMRVFREWPYLYDGDADYERQYLAAYAACADSVLVLVHDGARVVGASTGLPLLDDSAAFIQPFVDAALDPATVFYFAESVLLPAYRRRGLGHAFFDCREAHARALGRFATTAFCSVERSQHDPRRPHDYRPNDLFWTGRGYQRQPGMTVHLQWHELGRGELEHELSFWTRELGHGT
jgi:GNAT superfamily N-acetyltransferase